MINVDKVYQRVLILANKDQRGYITPDEFNSYAEQATNEIQSMYSLKMFQVSQGPASDSDYGDAMKVIEEKITYHDTVTPIAKTGNFHNYPEDFFQLGVVIANGIIADEVSHKDAAYINLSPLTKPTAKQPVYTRHTGGIRVYPDSISGVDINYLQKAIPGVWGYVFPTQQQIEMGVPNEPIYDEGSSRDFNLHPSEEHDLVYKILVLAGVTIKQADIAQFGQSKEAQISQTEI